MVPRGEIPPENTRKFPLTLKSDFPEAHQFQKFARLEVNIYHISHFKLFENQTTTIQPIQQLGLSDYHHDE